MSEENKDLTPWQKYKQKLGDTRPWDLINPKTEWAGETTANERLLICKACPELITLTSQCKKCGCFMNLKTKLEKATCPIGKW
jgi:hypothetical protein